VIVPIRALDVATASRVRMTKYGADLRSLGGLFGTNHATRQRDALAVIEYELVYTIARHDLDHTFLEFPRFARDARYLRDKLGFLDPSASADRWHTALVRCVQPDLIHEQPLSRSERALTLGGTVGNQAILRPIRGARAAVGRRRRGHEVP
jgi:hypothetical protein